MKEKNNPREVDLIFNDLFTAIDEAALWVEVGDLDCLPLPLRKEACRKLRALRDRLSPGIIWCWGTFDARLENKKRMRINGYLHKDRLLAVHKDQESGEWTISHVPTGYKLLVGLATLKRAKTCIMSLLDPLGGGRELLDFCDEKPLAYEEQKRLIALLKKCCKEVL